jgi:hypothetical protein
MRRTPANERRTPRSFIPALLQAPSNLREFEAGRRLMMEGLGQGIGPDLLMELARAVDTKRGSGIDQAAGAFEGMLQYMDALDRLGVKFRARGATLPSSVSTVLGTSGQVRRTAMRLLPVDDEQTVLGAIYSALKSSFRHITLRSSDAGATAPVSVELKLPAEPLMVRVVDVPTTTAVQTVTRDDRDEIVATVTTTRVA